MSEPVTLAEARAFRRVAHEGEDLLIERLLRTARERLELELGRPLDAASPLPLKQALLAWTAHAFERGEGARPAAVDGWIAPYRRPLI